MLFKPVDMARAELQPKEAMLLDRIKHARETVGDVKVLATGAEVTAQSHEPLHVPLPGHEKDLELRGYRVKVDDAGTKHFTWRDRNQSADLTLTGDCWEGVIYANNQVYSVRPLGRGLHAVSRVDQSRLPDEPPRKPR
jgi:hypothetical protein